MNNSNINAQKEQFEEMFKEYKDVVKPKDLMKMLGLGKNKVYELLKKQEIHYKRIGSNYIIPKISVIEYLINQ